MAKPETIELAPGVILDLVLVEPGYFIMGDEHDGPEHLIHITQPFYIGKKPVTQAQWQAVMRDEHESRFPGPKRPVERVSWIDVMEGNQEDNGKPAFMNRLNAVLLETRPDLSAGYKFSLPTEAQWEYAAKGGPGHSPKELEGKTSAELYSAYSGGDRLESCGWYTQNSHRETQPVGLKAPNELGLYDMSGNVWEWCRDTMDWGIYEQRKDAITSDPVNLASGVFRVVRGGSCWYGAGDCRVAYRFGNPPAGRYGLFGFRVVLSPSSGSGAAG